MGEGLAILIPRRLPEHPEANRRHCESDREAGDATEQRALRTACLGAEDGAAEKNEEWKETTDREHDPAFELGNS